MAKTKATNRGAPKGGQTTRLEGLDKVPRIKKMRDQGKSWGEIGDKLKLTPGTAQYLVLVASVKPSEKIKWDGENLTDLGKKIVRARDKDKLSWPVISARLNPNVTVGRVTDIYHRIKDGSDAAGQPRGRKPGKKSKASTNGKTKRGTAKRAVKATAKAKSAKAGKKPARRVKRRVKDPSAT